VTFNATASKQNGVIADVTFTANSQAVGTYTTAPYSTLWTNPAAGTYSVTATATDGQGQSVTSAPITVKISKALKAVKNGRGSASSISSSLTSGESFSANGPVSNSDQMDTLVTTLQQAYVDFTSERDMFSAAPDINKYLYAALFLAKSGASLSRQSTPTSGIIDRMNKIDSYLSFCEDLVVDGVVSQQNLTNANRVSARTDISINQPDVMPLGSNGVNLMQGNSGAITSASSAPLTTAIDVASGNDKFELGGVSVMVGGQAVPMISVSPTAITFFVPSDLQGGLADVVVTTRDGYITHTTASINGLNPMILVSEGEASTSGAIFDALGLKRDGLSAITSWWSGYDQQTRLSILTTGLSTGLVNTDLSNDVFLGNGKLLENYAEADAVQVEARTTDGRVIMLPVEFAGPNGTLRGLDQVTVRLSSELVGAGSVQITVIAGGRRSNMSIVTITYQKYQFID
jgi:uncharacterized protein (TIGR03437 family)